MNIQSTNMEQLIQKIIDRQAELTILTAAVINSKQKKESKYSFDWFREFEAEPDVFKLSKAI